MRLPQYAGELVRARERGMRPADPVFLTDSPAVARALRNWGNFYALVCQPLNADYDLSFLYQIEVIVVHLASDADAARMEEQLLGAGVSSVSRLCGFEWGALTLKLVSSRPDVAKVA